MKVCILEPMSKLSDFRKSYELGELDEGEAADGPLALFQRWMDEAIAHDVSEPTAMTVATVGASGRPSTRVVLLKGCDARGMVWFTNYESRKGEELALHPFAALQFHWVEMERVVRIEGRVEKTSPEESDDYFKSRPLDSRLGAWASPQSQVISTRAVLVANAAKAAVQHGLNPERPPHWGGYRLVPDRYEFWQGRRSRLHDRLRFQLDGGHWVRDRLAP